MAELADAHDLKSCEGNSSCGFNSRPGHQKVIWPGLTNPQNLILLFTAPAGLGHLRVSDALKHGLPKTAVSFILESMDPALTYLHRICSLNPFFRDLQFFVQYEPSLEKIFSKYYRWWLRRYRSQQAYKQLINLVNSRSLKPRQLIIVATHFGLAHEIAAIKDEFMRQTKIKLSLYVVVTDDTFQRFWAIDGADYLFVPSLRAKEFYKHYFSLQKLATPKIEFIPYPVSNKLSEQSPAVLSQRQKQLMNKNSLPAHLLIPISGAAVGLDFFKQIIFSLSQSAKVFKMTIVAKEASFTRGFLNEIKGLPNLSLLTGGSDRATVNLYEEAFFQEPVPSLELTKPSEQAFKALFEPRERGGVILLFTPGVGKQEDENLFFLMRHRLVPNFEQAAQLEEAILQKTKISENLLRLARFWRGLFLPQKGAAASLFIQNGLQSGLFQAMLRYRRPKDPELQTNGVTRFWQTVERSLV